MRSQDLIEIVPVRETRTGVLRILGKKTSGYSIAKEIKANKLKKSWRRSNNNYQVRLKDLTESVPVRETRTGARGLISPGILVKRTSVYSIAKEIKVNKLKKSWRRSNNDCQMRSQDLTESVPVRETRMG